MYPDRLYNTLITEKNCTTQFQGYGINGLWISDHLTINFNSEF